MGDMEENVLASFQSWHTVVDNSSVTSSASYMLITMINLTMDRENKGKVYHETTHDIFPPTKKAVVQSQKKKKCRRKTKISV